MRHDAILMTLGTRARKVEVYAPGDPGLECMRYPCSKGSIDIGIASVSCLDPWHIHIQFLFHHLWPCA